MPVGIKTNKLLQWAGIQHKTLLSAERSVSALRVPDRAIPNHLFEDIMKPAALKRALIAR